MITKLISALLLSSAKALDINQVGKIQNKDNSEEAERNNAEIFTEALRLVNENTSGDRTLWVPSYNDFSMFPINATNLDDVTIKIDGKIRATQNFRQWPIEDDAHVHFIHLVNCTDIIFEGSGIVDGQGYMWWFREILNQNIARRPKLFFLEFIDGLEFSGLLVKNSPSFHVQPVHSQNIYFHDFEIFVDIMGQLQLNLLFNMDTPLNAKTPIDLAHALQATIDKNHKGHLELPLFPLNTDGIDIHGRNATIRRVKITNFDDAVVAKPGRSSEDIKCTEDILVEDVDVMFGVGMSIGSVSPDINHECIRDFTARDIRFKYPFKALYVKTNPGSEGTAEIRNIWYENITMDTPIWFGIYIGPQQMKEPNGEGPGCMLYPLNNDCPTDPLVTISNITLKDIKSTGGVLPAGILRCNKTNPCTDFTFDNVDIRSKFWDFLGYGYISEYVEGTVKNNVFPDPQFKPKGYYAATPADHIEDEVFDLINLLTPEKYIETCFRAIFFINIEIFYHMGLIDFVFN